MAVLVPKVCVPELAGNRLAVGSVAAVVRLGSAYVAGLDGFLGVNALSGGCRERVTSCSGASGVKRPDRVKGRAIAGS